MSRMKKINWPDKYEIARMRPLSMPSKWCIGHLPFLFALVEIAKPKTIVELGSYSGASLFGFCQAVAHLQYDTRICGVDLWEGDVHMGEFSSSIYQDVSRYVDEKYPDTELIQKSFDDASMLFSDASIDILHIDGTHTYDAVRNDFETWKPKLSDQGVVLFHDTNSVFETIGEEAKNFGVREYFDQIKNDYPGFEFKHCYGWGVLFVGKNLPQPLQEMLEHSSQEAFFDYFEKLGNSLSIDWERSRKRHELKANCRSLVSKVVRTFIGQSAFRR